MDDFPQSPSKRVKLDTEEMHLDDPDDFYDDDKPQITSNPEIVTASDEMKAESVTAPSALPESVTEPENEPSSAIQDAQTVPNVSAVTASEIRSTSSLLMGSTTVDPEAAKTSSHLDAKDKPPTIDADFIEAAKVNKSDQNAEWRFDSSDGESSSDDSSDTSSDDSTSEEDSDEEDGVLLDPAEAARMLMKEEGGDEDGDKAPRGPIKTQNEQDASFNKPDITITPEMNIVELGAVENMVGNLALVKANTSGEYRVLESGSLLCLADRRVVGEVFEPLGRVHAPMYSVGFPQQSDIEVLGITQGTVIYYVEQHSTYVFTQTIKNLKGSDASNMHDEEAFGEEVEFSDDEAEAEYKRNLKQARQAKRAAAQGGQQGLTGVNKADVFASRNNDYAPPVPEASYPDAISYDDDGAEDMYRPLARPDNLSQMIGAAPPPLERRNFDNQRSFSNGRGRGDRGRGRGRGRGDRGARGGGGFNRVRGDRSNGYNREQRDNHGSPNAYTNNTPNQQQYQPSAPPVSWPPNAQQQPSFNLAQQFPPPPPPPAAFYGQQSQSAQQQGFDPQAWAQYFQQQAAQAPQQQQQAWQYQPQPQQQQQNAQPGYQNQANAQAAQNLSSLIQSLTQNGNRRG